MAFVYDSDSRFADRANAGDIAWQRVASPAWEGVLRDLVAEHRRETRSHFAEKLLADWEIELKRFWQVVPKEMLSRLPHPLDDRREALAGED
jgi:glutamate synthase (NADPH) large chain